MHGKEGDHHQSEQEGIGVEQSQKCSGIIPVDIQGNTTGEIAHGHADQQRGKQAADTKSNIPRLTPDPPRLLASEFNGHCAEDQGHEQQHEGIVKTGEDRGVRSWKCGKEGTSSGHQPDLISIPDRSDGVEKHPAILILFDEEMKDSHAKIKSVKDGISREEYADEEEPDGIKIGKLHCGKEWGWGVA